MSKIIELLKLFFEKLTRQSQEYMLSREDVKMFAFAFKCTDAYLFSANVLSSCYEFRYIPREKWSDITRQIFAEFLKYERKTSKLKSYKDTVAALTISINTYIESMNLLRRELLINAVPKSLRVTCAQSIAEYELDIEKLKEERLSFIAKVEDIERYMADWDKVK